MSEERTLSPDKLFFDALVNKGTSLIQNATPEQLAYLAKARKILMESEPTSSYSEQRNEVASPFLKGSHPFLYCRMKRHGQWANNGGYRYTNELGPIHNNSLAGETLLKQFTGGNAQHYDVYAIPPSLQFIGNSDSWLISNSYNAYSGGNNYNYPDYDLVCIFIQNKTDGDITRPFGRYYSANDRMPDYNLSSAYVGIPDRINGESDQISVINWNTVHTVSAKGSREQATFNVTVPANRTIALVYYSTPGMKNVSYPCHSIGIHSLGGFLTEGLEFDHQRTLKALQFRTPLIHKIWN